MVIQAEPVIKAVEKILKSIVNSHKSLAKKSKSKTLKTIDYRLNTKIIFFSPAGKQFDTTYAKNVSKKYTDMVLIAGRYEGIDARVKKVFKMEDVSVGPFVLTGGELPAMILIDCISRQVEGVLGNFDSLEESRVSSHDVYTRPEVFTHKDKKYRVPKVLQTGHHANIDKWRKES